VPFDTAPELKETAAFEIVLLMGEDEVYLTAFRKVDRVIENEPPGTHTSQEG
jgi:hypothetical protein